MDTAAEEYKSEGLPSSPSSTLNFDDGAIYDEKLTPANALEKEPANEVSSLQIPSSSFYEETKKVPIDEPEELQLQKELEELERFGVR